MGVKDSTGLLKAFDPHRLRIWRDSFGDLQLETVEPDGERKRYERVYPSRAYPLTAPAEFISFFDPDDNFVGMLASLDDVDAATRRLLEEEFDRRYFVVRITAVQSLRVNAGIISWRVETDRGPRTFEVRDRDDIRTEPPARLIIKDVDGNRYEVPDHTRLDRVSRELLEQLL
ncbi:MAG: DUF1854 domain-containing protein [Armatimonadetes bacterium]|jgi:hypothetical protein|nr:DUF1854 domain-containing protein [Armatimonadota bacterium]